MKRRTSLFIKFLNREISTFEMLDSFSRSKDEYTARSAIEAKENPPDLEKFREELNDAVSDLIREGLGKEIIAFVDHYMEPSLIHITPKNKSDRNIYCYAIVKDKSQDWIQGFICYNLSLYIKAFGLNDLKKCRVCNKFFDHKGKYAVYCSDVCKNRYKKENKKL